jgi:glutathione peroxidase-family protein
MVDVVHDVCFSNGHLFLAFGFYKSPRNPPFDFVVTAVLQERYRNRGFTVLAFPISDFNQELGSNKEIDAFVKENFPQVDFPIMSLSSLDTNPVYRLLQGQVDRTEFVKWNFFKYLVDGNGQVVKVFDQHVNPLALTEDIESLLEAGNGRGGHKLVTE